MLKSQIRKKKKLKKGWKKGTRQKLAKNKLAKNDKICQKYIIYINKKWPEKKQQKLKEEVTQIKTVKKKKSSFANVWVHE